MTTHRFKVNIPNPTTESASVQLRLEPAERQDFQSFLSKFPEVDLEVIDTGLSLDPCAARRKPSLKLELEPFTSVDVHVVINTAPARKPGVAGFHLVDRRNCEDVGGVFLVCSDPPFVEPTGQTVSTPNPCPATLAMGLYVMKPGGDPREPFQATPMQSGESLELVAQITNRTDKSLEHTQVYLEHLGASSVEFAPGTWNIGTLRQGAVFYATWAIRTTVWQPGSYDASIVVVSDDLDPVRLSSKISLAVLKKQERPGIPISGFFLPPSVPWSVATKHRAAWIDCIFKCVQSVWRYVCRRPPNRSL